MSASITLNRGKQSKITTSEEEGMISHVALLPSAGMGHLTPFLRLASLLVHNHCQVTLIIPQATVSKAESDFLSLFSSVFPQVNLIEFHLLPGDPATEKSSDDPFFLQFASIRRSSHLLSPILASLSPPLTAFVIDTTLISPVLPIADKLGVPRYILFTSSASMFSLFSYFHNIVSSTSESSVVEIPGVPAIPKSSIPPPLLVPNSIFGKIIIEDGSKVTKLNGILINTFEGLEAQSLEALNGGKVIKELPPVYPIGPFVPFEFEKVETRSKPLKWLDDKPDGSVVYVSFGSRTALERDQMREVGIGLVRSGFTFLWVVKGKKVDREEEKDEELDGALGVELVKRIKEKGLVVREWVDQSEILGHQAIGGFVSHCGWNSVVEAALNGVRILGLPQHGDQKINAEVISNGGWGVWKKDWGWQGECLVKAEEIEEAIKEMMNDESLRIKAMEVKKSARKAISVGGRSKDIIETLTEEWKKNANNI